MPFRNSRAGSLGLFGFVPYSGCRAVSEHTRCSGTGGRGDSARAVLIYDKMSKKASGTHVGHQVCHFQVVLELPE